MCVKRIKFTLLLTVIRTQFNDYTNTLIILYYIYNNSTLLLHQTLNNYMTKIAVYRRNLQSRSKSILRIITNKTKLSPYRVIRPALILTRVSIPPLPLYRVHSRKHSETAPKGGRERGLILIRLASCRSNCRRPIRKSFNCYTAA